MARLIAQSKMGFYPTPSEVIQHIKKMLDIKPGAKLFDPCCGEGALAELAEGSEARTYGVELDEDRYRKSLSKFTKVVWGDALHELHCTNYTFDLLFLNPPYDWEINENDKHGLLRTEVRFLAHTKRYLNPNGGVIVYIIPYDSLRYVWKGFAKMKNPRVFAFPKDLYCDFKQIVVIGKLTPLLTEEEKLANTQYFQNILSIPVEEKDRVAEIIETTDCVDDNFVKYTVDACGVELKTFHTNRLSKEEVAEKLKKSSLHKVVDGLFKFYEIGTIRPLTNLKNGHLAMLLASGKMNGRINTPDGDLVIKGIVREVFESVSSEDENEEIISKKYIVEINYIDLNNKKLVSLR